jgi:signal transduction histidine kinase
MYSPLFWIEWLDRLDRVLTSARQDVAMLKRAVSPRTLEAIERSKRQLGALMNDLRLLDRNVLATGTQNGADHLQKALDTAVAQLASLAEIPAASAPGVLDRMLVAVDAALRDSCYEAAMLLMPSRRRA